MKKVRNSKSQTAIEYLIIVTVVIIIVLVVVVIGISGIGKTAARRASAAYWHTADIAITSYTINSSEVVLKLRNNLKDTIQINNITLNTTLLTTTPATLQTIFNGETKEFTSTSLNCTAGTSYSYSVNIVYTNQQSTTHSFNGNGTKLEGICSQ